MYKQGENTLVEVILSKPMVDIAILSILITHLTYIYLLVFHGSDSVGLESKLLFASVYFHCSTCIFFLS